MKHRESEEERVERYRISEKYEGSGERLKEFCDREGLEYWKVKGMIKRTKTDRERRAKEIGAKEIGFKEIKFIGVPEYRIVLNKGLEVVVREGLIGPGLKELIGYLEGV